MPVLLSALNYVVAGHAEGPGQKPGSAEFWWKIGLSAVLVVAGGVFAGYATHYLPSAIRELFTVNASLTLGLMGLDVLHLRVLATSSDDPKEKKNAQTGESIDYSQPESLS